MKAIVLCAGYGTRLRPLTDKLPKPLIGIAGVTLLRDTLLHLHSQGIESAVVNGSWKGEMLRNYLQSTDLPIDTFFQMEEEPLGTAGAVRKALPFLGEDFLVVYGDNLFRQPIAPLVEKHRELSAEITVALSPTGRPSGKGIVLTAPNGMITSFREKPPDETAESNLANSGLYICSRTAVGDLEEDRFYDFGNSLFPEMLQSGRTLAAEIPGGYTRDIGTLKSFLLACHHVLSGKVQPLEPVPGLSGGRLIENEQSWEAIELLGTFWAERNSEIKSGCVLENCVIMDSAVVQWNCSIKNALVLPGSTVPEGTVADDKYLKIF
ncbi:MAG: NTP transferase domain-containing protein [Candidatus Aegiribacteria sp.]|nr:NTP transferase domain-containing protein [Candidatus Aegiribacteria sp.]MBD3295465.1 NTP transferase domain-containing protein [Candidatus Fermentibacteria bacterium]